VSRLKISPRSCWPRHSAWILIPRPAWNERKQIYEHSSLIIDSTSITGPAAVCGSDNHWTCTIAAAVFPVLLECFAPHKGRTCALPLAANSPVKRAPPNTGARS